MTKKSRQKLKYFEIENSFSGEMKNRFIIFKELSSKQITQCFLEDESLILTTLK